MAAVIVACAACEGAVPLGKRAPAVASVLQPWGKSEVLRTNGFVLPREARLTVVVIAEGHAPQEIQVLDQLKLQLPQNFGPQDLSKEALLADEAFIRAGEQRSDFLLSFRIERWPGGFVDPAATACPEKRAEECDLSSIDPDLKLTLQVYDVVNDRIVDLMSVTSSLGIQHWLVKDISPLINDTLSRMLQSLVP